MSIRLRILLSTAFLLLLMIAAMYYTSQHVLINGFMAEEKKNVSRDLLRVLYSIELERYSLITNASTLAGRKDISGLLNASDKQLADKSLDKDWMQKSNLNFVALANSARKIVFVKYINGTGCVVQPPAELIYQLSSAKLFANGNLKYSDFSGNIKVAGAVMMVVSKSVVSDKEAGSVHGTIIVGTFLRKKLLDQISYRVGANILTLPIHFSSSATQAELRTYAEKYPNVVTTSLIDDNTISARAPIVDINGVPIFGLEIREPRTIYQQGITGVAYFLAILIIIGLLFATLVLFIVDDCVLKRLAALSRSVGRLGRDGDMSARISMSGKDELSLVAESVNGMLAELEASQKELRRQEALRESEERYRGLVEVCPDAVFILSDGKCVFANTAATALMRAASSEELVGMVLEDMVHPEHRETVQSKVQELIAGNESMLRFEGQMCSRDGICVEVEIAGILFNFGNKRSIQLVARDITDKKSYQVQLDHLAHHDSLTDLPNRLLFSDRLNQRLADSRRYGQSMAVIFVDLDRFKMVNDTLGHSIGDSLLKEAARRLASCLRDTDTIARMGGDEFTIILPNIASVEDAVQVAKRGLDSIAKRFVIDDREIFVSASMGISIYPSDGLDVETLVKNADAAMYRAKELGGNNYQLYTQELNALILEKMRLETDLRRAAERNELVLCYQPRVDLHTGKTLGMEALIRWKHPNYGMLQPMQFIPIAEETGLIIPISEWVMKTACMQNKAWQDAGYPPVAMAVNISARHLYQQGDLVGTVKRVLDETGLSPEWLELELTECTIMHDADQASAVLGELQAMGVRISVDDFGTGYSSLTYLKTLPLNTIKIDRSFVKDITTNADDAAIASAVVAMARSLNLKVIAESVETLEQLEFLRSLKCDEMQGYFVSRPVPPEEFAQFFDAKSTFTGTGHQAA